jgi:hypothetical protein
MEAVTKTYRNGIWHRPLTVRERTQYGFDLSDNIETPVPNTARSEDSLPILATGNDVREIVRFLRDKPLGVTVIELASAEPRRVFDPRKIAAYEFWGVLERDGGRITLTQLGREMSRRITPEIEIYRQIIGSVATYVGALRAFNEQKLELVTRTEAVEYWRREHPGLDMFSLDEKIAEAIAVSFFSLCHAAELGTITIGKRGQPARLRIDMEKLGEFLDDPERARVRPFRQPKKVANARRTENVETPAAASHIYLDTGSQGEEQLEAAIEFAGFRDVVRREARQAAEFLPPTELSLMRQCQAAVFLLGADDCDCAELDAVRLAEINVARALLDGSVAILWNSRGGDPVPTNLSGYDTFTADWDALDWQKGVEIVNILKNLRDKCDGTAARPANLKVIKNAAESR